MSSVAAFRAFPWLLLLLLRWSEAAPQHIQDEALQQLRQLDLSQAKLIAANSSAKCTLTPNLCDWQLHLYEGHSFSVPLVQEVESKPSSTVSPPKAAQEIFELTQPNTEPQLFILAEIEPKSRRGKLRRRATFNHLSKQKFVLLVVQ
ncbi:uncharacterized protein [Drosophila takahashii]|uniref:uncharacterized protein n=1 Tax=Drosophila takahashii TaxID=29030 RepID=UPI001CF8434B|nr:uncharacterized protein LOC108054470 [Drosophila takahashii]